MSRRDRFVNRSLRRMPNALRGLIIASVAVVTFVVPGATVLAENPFGTTNGLLMSEPVG